MSKTQRNAHTNSLNIHGHPDNDIKECIQQQMQCISIKKLHHFTIMFLRSFSYFSYLFPGANIATIFLRLTLPVDGKHSGIMNNLALNYHIICGKRVQTHLL